MNTSTDTSKNITNTTKSNTGYNKLSTEELIHLAIDFVKVGQVLPAEVKVQLEELGLLHILDPEGSTDEENDN